MSDLPAKFGKYDVLGVAGRGSMGVVYIGHDPFADRRVAIKVCTTDADERSKAARVARKLFFNEAHAAGALDHPNILKVYDAGEEDGEPYIVMEFVEGGETLRAYCSAETLLPLRKGVEIIYQAAKALDYAHRRGVIHRDIKSTNIMLTPSGEVKLGDFGIAQYALSDSTQVMGVLGSPRYMSPEQAREEDVTSQTDIFSLGVVAYEVFCGVPPFTARGISRLIMKILDEDPAPLSTHRPGVPAELDSAVRKALAKKPGDRYATGQDFAIALAEVYQYLREEAPDDAGSRFLRLRKLQFFNDFTDPELQEVLAASRWTHFETGEHIITEGQLEHAFYILVDGVVGVTKRGLDISTLQAGDCFGEMGYLRRARRTASIVAKEPVTLVKFDSSLIEGASLGCQLRFNQAFLRTVLERLERTSEHLAQSQR